MPDSVKERFAHEGNRYFFPDGAPAFRDHGRRLTTPSENTEVIASLIEIAKSRGWDSITVRGTLRFREEAWRQGRHAGLEVRGYRATAAERAAMIRAIATRSEARSEAGPTPENASERRGDETGGAIRARRAADRVIEGKLLDHGIEHYQFDPKADLSYYVRLETPQGKRVIWGADFERAVKESLSRPQIGDAVVLQHRGADAVTVKRRERDGEGKVVSEKELATHRNTWSVEKRVFLDERAAAARSLRDPKISPRAVVESHPELAGTLLALKAADIAARRIRDPQDRERFLATVREAMADKVERGEPLQPMRLRERPATRGAPEREATPTR